VELMLPLIQQLARDHEAEIRSTAVKQLSGLGEHILRLTRCSGAALLAVAAHVTAFACVPWYPVQAPCSPQFLGRSCHAGTALYEKDAERSMRDIEATLLVCAQQCAVDDEDEVSRVGTGPRISCVCQEHASVAW
jgi:hypothetical protein